MLTVRCVAASVLLGLLLAPAASGRDIHVDNLAGDDTFTGLQTQNLPDRSGPVRSIVRALRLATRATGSCLQTQANRIGKGSRFRGAGTADTRSGRS